MTVQNHTRFSLVQQFEALISSSNINLTEIQHRVNFISGYLQMHSGCLAKELQGNENQKEVYKRLKDRSQALGLDNTLLVDKIDLIFYRINLLGLESLGKNQERVVDWLNQVQQKHRVEIAHFAFAPNVILDAFDAAKEALKPSRIFFDLFQKTIAKMVITSFRFSSKSAQQVTSFFDNDASRGKILDYFIRYKNSSLAESQLSFEDLCRLAPYLFKVDCRDVSFKDNDEVQKFIKSCSRAVSLFINSDQLEEIDWLPDTLEEVDFENCARLKKIKILNHPKLERIDFDKCPLLEEVILSNIPYLKDFMFEETPSLTSFYLSDLDLLEDVYVTESEKLKECSFYNLKKIESIVLTGCDSLKFFTALYLPELRSLDCSYNPLLEGIVAESFPKCEFFDYSHSPLLSQLPQLPLDVEVISEGSLEFNSFEVDQEKLKENPLQTLLDLGQLLFKFKSFPNITYLNSDGIDYGGLRRQFITTLFQTLFKKEPSVFEFKKIGEEKGVLPFISDLKREEILSGFKAIGALMGVASIGFLPLGNYLSDRFYWGFYGLTHEEIDSINDLLSLSEPFIKKICGLVLYGDENWDFKEEAVEAHLAFPIACVAKGFKAILSQSDFEKVRKFPIQKFIDRIEGECVSWDLFKEKSAYRGDPEGIEKIRLYFELFFKEFKDQKESLFDMVELFTGGRSLGNKKIHIFVLKEKNEESLFEISTCFQEVQIPIYKDYAVFKEKFFKTLECVSGQFDKE